MTEEEQHEEYQRQQQEEQQHYDDKADCELASTIENGPRQATRDVIRDIVLGIVKNDEEFCRVLHSAVSERWTWPNSGTMPMEREMTDQKLKNEVLEALTEDIKCDMITAEYKDLADRVIGIVREHDRKESE